MSCEHLICAHCAGPVVEGRCRVCREAKARVHHHASGLPPQVLIAVALILLLGLLVAMHVA
ncbi:MAG TPA: hypothetical protein VG164_14955 [Trebonia sp.]|nr:hypothetical protein [Trebonia sp.]